MFVQLAVAFDHHGGRVLQNLLFVVIGDDDHFAAALFLIRLTVEHDNAGLCARLSVQILLGDEDELDGLAARWRGEV